MKLWRNAAAAIGVIALTAVAGCSAGAQATPADGRLAVAVAFYPFAFVAERVGGDSVTVTNLTQPGAEPHDLELTPRQVAALASADLVIYQTGFQPAVDAAIAQSEPKRRVDTASFLTLKPAAGGVGDAQAKDPHTWLDPNNMVLIAERVRDALSEARPAAAQQFAANAEALVADLRTLDAGIRDDLTGCRITTFITSHAAFGYLASRYGLTQVGISGLEPDVEPTAARIAAVQQIARSKAATTIFFETLVSPVVADSIANDLGLKTDVLDPLEGITAESRGADYLEVMRANATALKAANQCS